LVPRKEEQEENLVDKSYDDMNLQHKSDVVDSESPHNTDGNKSGVVLNQIEFSQDEEILRQNLLTVPFLPKVEDAVMLMLAVAIQYQKQ
jgi:hypothetical protein